jgi:hypothetical protein
MAKGKTEYDFLDGSKITPQIVAGYANVKKPDDEYNSYVVMLNLPKDDAFTKQLFKSTLDLENRNREKCGAAPVEYPSNWLKDGKPSTNEDGTCCVVKAVMKAENANGETRKPKVYNANAVEDYTIDIWGGDTVRVEFSVGVWTRGKEVGSKYFLRSVQLVKEGPREGGHGNPFQNEAAVSQTDEVETVDDDDVPF